MTREFDILDVDAGTRIDKYLSEELPDISRSYIQKLIKLNLHFQLTMI